MADLRRLTAAAAAGLLALGGAACSGDDAETAASSPTTFVALDGSPRTPDDAGVLTALDESFATLVLDGETVYDLSPAVQSFASIDGSTQPLKGRVGQYVQVGLDGDTVVWVAGLGAVVRLDGQAEQVVYLGRIATVQGDRIELQDGTVLRLADGVTVGADPSPGSPIAAVLTIDVATDRVVEVELA